MHRRNFLRTTGGGITTAATARITSVTLTGCSPAMPPDAIEAWRGPDDYATTSLIKDFNQKLDSTPGFFWMVTEGQ